ncbi:glycosyltransferase family 2 protein [Acetobacteraceae bacterium]|nr:glycosyltransferase family 2 protein [Acetobacteraceae bacterium]
MVRSAVTLFVKDEVQDIVGWIAWHFSIGFEKIFIYDDHSTDGTYELCKLFSKFYNVEVIRTDSKIQNFYWRQADSYKKACRAAIGKFDWICFLDGDEYISLEKDVNISAFLERFSDFNGIALSWRMYGSSGRVVKSKAPTYEAYTYHCQMDLEDCELGKVFIRPESFTFNYGNPHHFTLHDEKYANAWAKPIDLSQKPTHEIIWENACVNHYIVRSMQDFVEKVSKRINSNMTDSDGYWQYFNRNELQTLPNEFFVQKARKMIDFIKRESVKKFLSQGYVAQLAERMPAESKSLLYRLRTAHNATFTLERHSSKVVQDFGNKAGDEVVCVIYENNKNICYFLILTDNDVSTKRFYFEANDCMQSSIAFRVYPSDGLYAFQSLESQHFMACIPEALGGSLVVDRDSVNDWEKFRLEPIERGEVFFSADPTLVHDEKSFAKFIAENNGYFSYGDFLIAWNNMDISSQKKILSSEAGRIISWL